MRTTLITAAVLGALSATAFANDAVTIYGQVNVGVVFDKTTTTSKMKVDNLYTSSRLGFKGEEKLDNGMKAFFQIESKLAPDDATAGSFANREGWVGLQGDFGKVALGRGKTPYTNLNDQFDIFDGGSLANVLYGVDGIAASRLDNAIRFDSANLDGFTTAVMIGMGENKDDAAVPAKKETTTTSLNLRYTIGAYNLFGGYQAANNIGGVSGTDSKAYMLGAGAKIDAFTVQAAWQLGDKEAAGVTTVDRNSFIGTVNYAMGATSLRAGLIVAGENNDVADTDYTQLNLGVKHALSKRTNVIAEYARKDFAADGQHDPQTFAVGLLHSF